MHLTHQFDSKSITTKDRRNKATNQGVSLPSRTIVHAKLEMTSPQDAEEIEADDMANAIISGGKIKRKISRGSTGSSGIAVSSQMEGQLSRLQGGGRQMPAGLQNMMENGFGRDFSQVRLHTDSDAASMSSSIHAKAFTFGNDIYFNQGQYSPDTSEGQRLVAHELAHVAQGGGKLSRKDVTNTQTTSSIQELCIDGNWSSKSELYNEQIGNARIMSKKMLDNVIDKLEIVSKKLDIIIQSLAEKEENNQWSNLSEKINIEGAKKDLKKKLKDGETDQGEVFNFYINAAKQIDNLFLAQDAQDKLAQDKSKNLDISGILFLLEYCFGLGQSKIIRISNSLQFNLMDFDESKPDSAFEKIENLFKDEELKKEFKNKKNHYKKYETIIEKILKGYEILNEKIETVVIIVADPKNMDVDVDGWACNNTKSGNGTVKTVNGYNITNTIFLLDSFVLKNKNNLGEISSTIIHELSHVFLETSDIWYFGDNNGKEGGDFGISKDLTQNADSFSVFAKYLYSSEFNLSTLDNGEAVRFEEPHRLPRFSTFTKSEYKGTSIVPE